MAALGGIAGHYKSWRQREKRKSAEKTSGVFGNAAFATLEECEAAGLLEPNGLSLGLLDGQPLFFDLKAHALLVSPARTGKGTDCVIQNLLHVSDSMVVSDPKGELVATTSEHRAAFFGHRIVVFNPWGLHGQPQHRINSLQIIIKLASDPALQRGLGDAVKGVVLQLLPEPEDQKNKYFRDGSRAILRAVILYLALHAPERCTLA